MFKNNDSYFLQRLQKLHGGLMGRPIPEKSKLSYVHPRNILEEVEKTDPEREFVQDEIFEMEMDAPVTDETKFTNHPTYRI